MKYLLSIIQFIIIIIIIVVIVIVNNIIEINGEKSNNMIRCPNDFDNQRPYDPKREKEIYDKIIKRGDIDEYIQKLLNINPNGNLRTTQNSINNSTIIIPIIFYVITSSSVKQKPPLEAYIKSIEKMNEAFSGNDEKGGYPDSSIRFTLQGIQVIENKAWSTGCGTTKIEFAMKKATAIEPERYLNVWVCNIKSYLGFAYLPDSWDETDPRHGVVLNVNALPEVPGYKPFEDYNEGDTLVHEVGHYLGLEHTFRGGCSKVGDFIEDTPAEKSAAYGKQCFNSKPRDTCKSPGVDPVTNYMDYSDDICLYQFSKLQAARMRTMIFEYRPTLAENSPRECVSGGSEGNAGAWKICKSECFTTKTPINTDAPKNGWCYTSDDKNKWGNCCCVENGCVPGENIY